MKQQITKILTLLPKNVACVINSMAIPPGCLSHKPCEKCKLHTHIQEHTLPFAKMAKPTSSNTSFLSRLANPLRSPGAQTAFKRHHLAKRLDVPALANAVIDRHVFSTTEEVVGKGTITLGYRLTAR